ncbi:hypothetical protein SLEP1_g37944 [Rubroshorea leprosula]|uniref:Retrovirus-related Pol polyprotein from transposon TNT 1-94 n=1 Tax=Rubroshorea leprosula TaxID=152421 RepID=A0AAV5KWC3_9ROSI|nr:hypothetical protein SLEP1_g37944 [Rubroshorea leprosula]
MANEKDGSTMIKLNTSNYSLWKTLMEDKLFCKDLYDPIEHKGIKLAEINDADWKKIDRKACGVIRKWVDMSVIHNVAQEKESYKLWTKLEELFERKNALKKASLIRKLVNLKYKEGKNVSEHLNKFQEILNELVTGKLAIDDEVQALILLSSLPDSWETLVVTLSNSTRDGEMTLQLVKDSILSEESKRKEKGIMSSESEALVTEYRGRSKQRYIRRDNDRQSQERYSKGKSRGRSKSKSKVTCYTCGKQGHYQKDCWHNRDKNVRKRADTHEEKEAKENTTAITSNGEMGNKFEAKIVGVGDVWLETNIESKLHLKNVRYVPEIRLNLMSMGMLDDDGYLNYFGNGSWKLTKGTMVVARGKKRFSLYETQAKQCQGQINVTEADATKLWHKRLGHLSEKGLQIVSKKELLPGFTSNLSKTCADCLAGKHHKVSFHTLPLSRRKYALDLVHTDVCFMKDKSLGGATYFVTVVDDFSRKLWAYPLSSKDQFERYCREKGIKLEKTTPRTPQHNGVAERMNRTICDRIVCMLSHAKLPKFFWGEALKTAIYLINRSPSVVLNGDVPEKVWSGKEVSYKNLRVFGCRAYVHVPKEERAKLDAKTKQCVFLGYGDKESKRFDLRFGFENIARKYSTDEYVLLTDGGEPKTYYEAMESGNKKEWLMAMQEEMSSLQGNGTYKLVELPKDKMALNNKWVFRVKSKVNNPNPRFKARLVVKGFGQQKGIDYDETFSPIVKMPSLRAILDLAASLNLEIKQLDVKTAFLHGDLEEEIYMKQPEGFEVQGKKNLVCKLKKSLYGLKQAPRQWYRKFDSFMGEHKFARTESDHCVYVKRYPDGDFLILLLYVDDMLIVGHDTKKIAALKIDLSTSFSMKDLGPAKQILGMKIFRDRKNKKLWLSQEKYIEKVLDRFNMSKAKPVGTPLASHFKLSTKQCPASKEEA